ncbi:MAG: UDP-N-acetylmuramoyl-L-alanyl-D-glutamate--2,6-diaminopimelate ligase [Firmicutes bacterium]|nr:UDP-N-acetylmuramoyl-L-alanyl-D-glutamate--2,6-diaminopimelate ligase [Bacillota bacterium]
MDLSQLLQGVTLLEDHIGQDVEITSLSCDTRTLEAGALFVALPGYRWDGSDFIEEALSKGAVAVLCAEPPPKAGPWLVAEDPRRAFARLSANWFGNPARELTLLGVTGTNGKTTTACLLKTMVEQVVNTKVGLIGTNQNMVGDRVLPAVRTTPESYDLHQLLRTMADEGCTHVVMEVSSHALVLSRVEGLFFKAAIFTNLTQDHLDFHGTMENYREAKSRLFQQCETGIFNLDDEAGRLFAETAPCKRYTYSENKKEADLLAENIRLRSDRVEFEALTLGAINRVRLPIPGGFTIYNALGVIACGLVLGFPLPAIAGSLSSASGVKGRIEVVSTPAPYTVIIDYAHTPDALENILLTTRDFTEGRLVCLFGCGGDRDRTKRPIMGEIAASLADLVVLTSDNPRTENPEDIMRDIMAGIPEGTSMIWEPDRRQAIRLALGRGQPGDVIVLAGKGHETYQEIGTQKFHLDEREEVAAYFCEVAPVE